MIYHEYYQPTLGCRGGGVGAFYIDPLANVHACPFCRQSAGNLLTERVDTCVERLRKTGCGVSDFVLSKKEKSEQVVLDNV